MWKQYIIIMINLMTRMIIMIIKNSMTMIKDNKIKINWMIFNLLRKSKQAKFKLSPTLQILFCPTNLEPLPKFDHPIISLLIMLVIYFIIIQSISILSQFQLKIINYILITHMYQPFFIGFFGNFRGTKAHIN